MGQEFGTVEVLKSSPPRRPPRNHAYAGRCLLDHQREYGARRTRLFGKPQELDAATGFTLGLFREQTHRDIAITQQEARGVYEALGTRAGMTHTLHVHHVRLGEEVFSCLSLVL